MKDPEQFWRDYDECYRRVREESIVNDRIVTLRPDMTRGQCAAMAVDAVYEDTRSALGLEAHIPLDDDALGKLEAAGMLLVRLAQRLRMKRSTVHLCSQFGRAP
jgi:hypothetical protein